MSWRNKSDLGEELVAEVHAVLRIQDQWMIEQGNGFTWWAADFAQSVWCDMGLYFNAQTTYRLHAETDLLRGRRQPHLYESVIEKEMDACSFSAVIYDEPSDTFRLHTSIFATHENVGWLKKVFFAAVALQVAEASQIGHKLATAIGGVPASSAHPTAGIRSTPDPNLAVVPRYFGPQGVLPSRWTGAPEWQLMERTMEREAHNFWCDHRSALTADFPWDAGPSPESRIRLEISSEQPHPVLGNGLCQTLTVPLRLTPEHVARMALELNAYERKEWKRSQMLGSWVNHNDTLAYRCFVPNTVYNPEILQNLSLSMAVRAQWVNEFFMVKKHEAMSRSAAPPTPEVRNA